MSKLKNSTHSVWQLKKICDKTKKLKKLWRNSKTQIVTKPKNLNCYKTQNLKLWKIRNPNCDKTKKKSSLKKKLKKNLNCDQTQWLQLWQNSNHDKTEIVTKLVDSNSDNSNNEIFK